MRLLRLSGDLDIIPDGPDGDGAHEVAAPDAATGEQRASVDVGRLYCQPPDGDAVRAPRPSLDEQLDRRPTRACQ